MMALNFSWRAASPRAAGDGVARADGATAGAAGAGLLAPRGDGLPVLLAAGAAGLDVAATLGEGVRAAVVDAAERVADVAAGVDGRRDGYFGSGEAVAGFQWCAVRPRLRRRRVLHSYRDEA